MPLTGQIAGWGWAQGLAGEFGGTITVEVPKGDAFAEIAPFWLWVVDPLLSFDETTNGQTCAITQIVSDSGTENWSGGVPVAFRKNMSSITFRIYAYQSYVGARFMIDLH